MDRKPEDLVSPVTRRRFMEVLAEMRRDNNEARAKTSSDYQRGRPMNNARLFIELSDWSFLGVDDEGIFCEKNSAGTFRFHTLVDLLLSTDLHDRLSVADAEEAIAMLYHLTPALRFESDDADA